MVGWAVGALVALAMGVGPGAAAPGGAAKTPQPGVCELRGADRAATSSLHCMACHDGTAGTEIPFQMTSDGSGMSHPVEIDYGAAAAHAPTHYRPPGALPREVPLVNGKVACTSCHDGASPDPKHVVAIPRLCESCHNL